MQRHPINAHFAWRTVENSWTPENGPWLLCLVVFRCSVFKAQVPDCAGLGGICCPRHYKKRGKGGGGIWS